MVRGFVLLNITSNSEFAFTFFNKSCIGLRENISINIIYKLYFILTIIFINFYY